MGKRWFERILSILSNRQRASEITGDLLEHCPGVARFWWSAFQVLVSFAWRPVAGVLGGQIVLISAFFSFSQNWFQAGSPPMRIHWQMLSLQAGAFTQLAWPVACMALAKFGRRSPSAAAACTLAALATLVSCSFSNLPVLTSGLVAGVIIVAAMLLHSADRRRLALISRAAFSIWLIETAGTRAGFELLRHLHLPIVTATHVSMSFTFVTWLVSSTFGWLALGSQNRQRTDEHERRHALVAF